MKLFVLSGLGICVLCSMCQTRECRPNKGAPWFFFFEKKMYDAFTGNDWTMRWNKWMYDAVYEMSGWCVFFFFFFKNEWMCDAFYGRCVFLKKWVNVRCVLWNEWAMRLKVNECTMRFMCVFFFLSLYVYYDRVDMKCHVPMRPIFTAQWSEVSILYPGIQFALFIWGSTASWLVEVPPDYCQLIEHWLPMMCLPIGSLSFRHLTMLHFCQCVCLCVFPPCFFFIRTALS